MRIIAKFIFIFIIFSESAYAKGGVETPYFASIRADEANVRTGPSVRYPIQWVYKKRNWPVKVTATFENWRKISDINGEVGWIHESLLTGRRNTIIQANGVQELYRLPMRNSSVTAVAENGVVASLLECKKMWCKIVVDDNKGWVESKYLWGAEESVN